MAIVSEKIDGKKIEVLIESSNLKSATYHTEDETLGVIFNSGAEYVYSRVPWGVFTKFRVAESQGKFFNSDISRKYDYKRIK